MQILFHRPPSGRPASCPARANREAENRRSLNPAACKNEIAQASKIQKYKSTKYRYKKQQYDNSKLQNSNRSAKPTWKNEIAQARVFLVGRRDKSGLWLSDKMAEVGEKNL